jgi:hypothetical protein
MALNAIIAASRAATRRFSSPTVPKAIEPDMSTRMSTVSSRSST